VSIVNNAIFTMSSGIIYGTNEVNPNLQNTATNPGASVFVNGIAKYGDNSPITTTDDTIIGHN